MSLFQVTKKQVTENYELRTMTGDIVSFTPSYSQLLPDPFSDLNVTVNVTATGGNGTPDNPIPINGYTEANITRCGVNFLPTLEPQTISASGLTAVVGADGVITLNNTSTSSGSLVLAEDANGIFTMPSGLYVHLINDFTTSQVAFIFDFKDGTSDGPSFNVLNRIWVMPSAYVGKVVTKIRIYFNSGVTLTNAKCSPMLALSSTAIPYETYNGNTYTIAFGQTVYGGVLDVTSGKLTVTWAKKPFADLVDVGGWNRTGTGIFYIYPLSNAFSNFKSPFTDNPKSTHFEYQTSGTLLDGCFRCSDALYFVKDDEPDIASMKTWFTNTNGFFAYELATPIDIDLTPEVISAIVGENNVFADCGQTTVTCLI